jgi:hypothetical protein
MCEDCDKQRVELWNKILEIADDESEAIKNLYTIAEEHFGMDSRDEIENKVLMSRCHALVEIAALVANLCPDTNTHGVLPHVILHRWAEEMQAQYDPLSALRDLIDNVDGIEVAVIDMSMLFPEPKPRPRKKKPKQT